MGLLFSILIEKDVMKSEAELQKSIVEYLKKNYPQVLVFSVPNEATYRRRHYFKKLGMLSGVSDLILVFLNGILFIECKTPRGKQSIEQINFHKRIEVLGFKYYIIRDLEEMKELLNNEININIDDNRGVKFDKEI